MPAAAARQGRLGAVNASARQRSPKLEVARVDEDRRTTLLARSAWRRRTIFGALLGHRHSYGDGTCACHSSGPSKLDQTFAIDLHQLQLAQDAPEHLKGRANARISACGCRACSGANPVQ